MKTRALVLSLAMIGAGGCSEASNDPDNVDVITWWNKHGEYQAMQRLIDIFESKYPNQTVNHAPYGSSDDARRTTEVAAGYMLDTLAAMTNSPELRAPRP